MMLDMMLHQIALGSGLWTDMQEIVVSYWSHSVRMCGPCLSIGERLRSCVLLYLLHDHSTLLILESDTYIWCLCPVCLVVLT
jgi:hypothetical protein